MQEKSEYNNNSNNYYYNKINSTIVFNSFNNLIFYSSKNGLIPIMLINQDISMDNNLYNNTNNNNYNDILSKKNKLLNCINLVLVQIIYLIQ